MMSEKLQPKKKGEKVPEKTPEGLKTAKEIFQACIALGPGEKLPGKYLLQGEDGSSTLFSFEVSLEGTFIAKDDTGESYTYIELLALMRERGAKGFTPVQEPEAKASHPPISQAMLSRSERMTAEVRNSAAEIFRNIHERRADRNFLKQREERLKDLKLVTRIQKLKKGQSEDKTDRGTMVLQGKTLPPGMVLEEGADLSDALVPTLTIRLMQATQAITSEKFTTPLAFPQIELLIGILDEVAEVGNKTSELGKVLREKGIGLARVEVVSWRERAGEKYSITIPLVAVPVPEK